MGPPSPPVPLTAANLVLLQTRQATPPARAATDATQQPDPSPPTPPPGASGRGRLVDILV